MILGIETSCDECSAAVIQKLPFGNFQVLSLVTHSQVHIHQPYGGVVPEIASRSHLEMMQSVIDQALNQASCKPLILEAIAVTNRPGLMGALLIGVSAAKTLAYAWNKPLVAVHHLEGHIASLFLKEGDEQLDLNFPLLVAVVSGGHTHLYWIKEPPLQWPKNLLSNALIARTRDDAAGEAFDKTAKLLGFDYPGGIWIEQNARGGNPNAFFLPRALGDKHILDYSFSGLKTAVFLLVEKLKKENSLRKVMSDLCASIQEAIVDALISKIALSVQKYPCKGLAVVGGVAANQRLREKLKALNNDFPIFFPDLKYCTDNAAMIAAAGAIRFAQGDALDQNESLFLNAIANAVD